MGKNKKDKNCSYTQRTCTVYTYNLIVYTVYIHIIPILLGCVVYSYEYMKWL